MKIVLCLILVVSFLEINAQERFFQKLRKVEDFSWIVPLDFEQAMDSLILEACVKNFYVDGRFLDYRLCGIGGEKVFSTDDCSNGME